MRKTAATSASNCSGRPYDRYLEFEESKQTVLLSRKETQIRPKVQGAKKDFFQRPTELKRCSDVIYS